MEDLIPFLFMIAYLVLRFLGKFSGGNQQQAEEGPPRDGGGYSVDDVLQELMGDLGAEQPVLEEHRRTQSEHRPTREEHQATFSERQPTPSEHLRTVTEVYATRSEHRLSASEHRLSWGEHLKGDVQLPPAVEGVPAAATVRTRSRFGQAVVNDLQGGKQALARALVMNEILGPPVSLRSGERS